LTSHVAIVRVIANLPAERMPSAGPGRG
jgi:hypothetical protein